MMFVLFAVLIIFCQPVSLYVNKFFIEVAMTVCNTGFERYTVTEFLPKEDKFLAYNSLSNKYLVKLFIQRKNFSGYVITDVSFQSGNSFVARWNISDFWKEETECIPIMRKLKSRVWTCSFTTNVPNKKYHQCYYFKFRVYKSCWQYMSKIAPITKPPIIRLIRENLKQNDNIAGVLQGEILGETDRIECHTETITPEPTLEWELNESNELSSFSFYQKPHSNVIGARIAVKLKTYKELTISCVSRNVVLGATFEARAKKRLIINMYSATLVVTPKTTFFYKNDTITCNISNGKCQWLRRSGRSDLKTSKILPHNCILHIIPKRKEEKLFGGLYEWTCAVFEDNNKVVVRTQRKLFYVLRYPETQVEVLEKLKCLGCESGKKANAKGFIEYSCEYDDDHLFPAPKVYWEVNKKHKHLASIYNENKLRLNRLSSSQTVIFVAICTMAYKRYDKISNTYSPRILGTKSYTFSSETSCPTNLMHICSFIVSLIILLLFIVGDVALLRFIYQSQQN